MEIKKEKYHPHVDITATQDGIETKEVSTSGITINVLTDAVKTDDDIKALSKKIESKLRLLQNIEQ